MTVIKCLDENFLHPRSGIG